MRHGRPQPTQLEHQAEATAAPSERCMMLTGQPRRVSARKFGELCGAARHPAGFVSYGQPHRTEPPGDSQPAAGRRPPSWLYCLSLKRSPKWIVVADPGRTPPARPTAPAAPTSTASSPKARPARKRSGASSGSSATPSSPACKPTPPGQPRPPQPRAREGNRGTTLHPGRPAPTPNTGASDKPLSGLPPSLRPRRSGGPSRSAVIPREQANGSRTGRSPAAQRRRQGVLEAAACEPIMPAAEKSPSGAHMNSQLEAPLLHHNRRRPLTLKQRGVRSAWLLTLGIYACLGSRWDNLRTCASAGDDVCWSAP